MKSAKKEEAKKFEEFKYSGKCFEYSGRLYEGSEGKGKVKSRSYLSLTLNDAITINGCYFVVLDDGASFITYPQYKKGEEYKSYIFTSDDLKDELEALSKVIKKLVF